MLQQRLSAQDSMRRIAIEKSLRIHQVNRWIFPGQPRSPHSSPGARNRNIRIPSPVYNNSADNPSLIITIPQRKRYLLRPTTEEPITDKRPLIPLITHQRTQKNRHPRILHHPAQLIHIIPELPNARIIIIGPISDPLSRRHSLHQVFPLIRSTTRMEPRHHMLQ
jgi:hypothetical protein